MGFEISLVEFLNQAAGRYWLLDFVLVFLAYYLPVLLVFASLFFGFKIANWRYRLLFFSLSLSSLILSWGVISRLFQYFLPRRSPLEVLPSLTSLFPAHPASFPSDHAVFLFTVAASVFIFHRRWGTALALISLIAVAARVIIGVHWVSDILAGALLGFLTPLFLWRFFQETAVKIEDNKNPAEDNSPPGEN